MASNATAAAAPAKPEYEDCLAYVLSLPLPIAWLPPN